MVRTADRAIASAKPSCLPPRGPVDPNSTSFNWPLTPSSNPPDAGWSAAPEARPGAPDPVAADAASAVAVGDGLAPPEEGTATARPLSFSYADSRSTVFS